MKEKKKGIIDNIKKVSAAVMSVGVGAIVSSIISNNTTKPKNPIVNLCFAIGGLAIGGMIVDQVTDYCDGVIDGIADNITKVADRIRKETEKNEEEDDE